MNRPSVPYVYKYGAWYFAKGYSGLDEFQGNIEEWVKYADYLENEVRELKEEARKEWLVGYNEGFDDAEWEE